MNARPAPDNIVTILMHRDYDQKRDDKRPERIKNITEIREQIDQFQLSAPFPLRGDCLACPYAGQMIALGDVIKGDRGINMASR